MERALPDHLGYVKASGIRKDVVCALGGGQVTPTEIADSTGRPQSRVSEALKELRVCGLAVCENPERRKGKLYSLTDAGQLVRRAVGQKAVQAGCPSGG